MNKMGQVVVLGYEVIEQKSKLMPKIGDVVKLVPTNKYTYVIHAFTKSGTNSIEIPHSTIVTVLETWHNYVRIKYQKYTKRWVHIDNIEFINTINIVPCIKDLYKSTYKGLAFKAESCYRMVRRDDYIWILDEEGYEFSFAEIPDGHSYVFKDYFIEKVE